ncbi:hypothetical protein [Thiobaca trueperi]|uniref:Uncharacterized protein n=1 Tax=Thiobaca trueperi TaxID=127458 RepID=A0A4R3MWS4_9GAMM|nr:hypothetical protein [Thiobaca trueperi]TCT20814.1 hypothetical protein EDC35_105258 [Thiobaca trueperi]
MNQPNILTRIIDTHSWHDEFFPPLTPARILARIAGMVAVFLTWVALSLLITIGLIRLGVGLEIAALPGLLVPPLTVMALNAAGIFNRPRGDQKNLKAFQRWITGPPGQQRGLSSAHLARIQPQGHNRLLVEVTPDWLAQPADKRLADLAHWHLVWDFCRDAHADNQALELTVTDQSGQILGGSSPDDGGSVWLDQSCSGRSDADG